MPGALPCAGVGCSSARCAITADRRICASSSDARKLDPRQSDPDVSRTTCSYSRRQIAALGAHCDQDADLDIRVRHSSRLAIPIPPLSTQRKIAAILSAYDDLIENNNRRIKILEEMAQRIYREWFVDFRYPGHENVPLVDSELGPIPEGGRRDRSETSLSDHVGGSAVRRLDDPIRTSTSRSSASESDRWLEQLRFDERCQPVLTRCAARSSMRRHV